MPDGQSDKVELPIAGSYSRFQTLVRDAEGGCHWVFANQVAIRGQNHSKGYFLKPIQQIASICYPKCCLWHSDADRISRIFD